MMLALLEPDGRAPTMQAWLAHDENGVFGHGLGNGYATDCPVPGSESCSFSSTTEDAEDAEDDSITDDADARTEEEAIAAGGAQQESNSGLGGTKVVPERAPEEPQYGFYCYNPWAFFLTMSNHLRLNNDTAFFNARAASSNKTVEEALARGSRLR
jgi:hypothetical protein